MLTRHFLGVAVTVAMSLAACDGEPSASGDAGLDVARAADASDLQDHGPSDSGVDSPESDAVTASDTGVANDSGSDPPDAGFDVTEVTDEGGTDTGDTTDTGSPVDITDTGNGIDVQSVDTGIDVARVDTGIDVPRVDSGVDVPRVDAGVDAGVDARLMDAGPDVPRIDTGVDVPRDNPPPDVQVTADPVVYTGTFPNRGGRFTANLTVMGEQRRVVLSVPRNATAAPALLLVFHGTNADGNAALDDTNAPALSDPENVVVVAPTSRFLPFGDFDHATAETYWETAPNTSPDANQDLLLVRAILQEARRVYGVDPRRVYAMGHSNGGFFSLFVAQILRARIAAWAENSAGLVRCPRTSSCRFQGAGTTCDVLRTRAGWCSCTGPELPVPIATTGWRPPGYLAHGTRDPINSVYFTCAAEERMRALGVTVVTALRDGEGHSVPPSFAQQVWPFFRNRLLLGP